MGRVKLITGMLLTTCSRPRRNLCYLIFKKDIIMKFFSEIKPLEHYEKFTFYIIQKKFIIKIEV